MKKRCLRQREKIRQQTKWDHGQSEPAKDQGTQTSLACLRVVSNESQGCEHEGGMGDGDDGAGGDGDWRAEVGFVFGVVVSAGSGCDCGCGDENGEYGGETAGSGGLKAAQMRAFDGAWS